MGIEWVVQDYSGERYGGILSPWMLNAYMDAVMEEVTMKIGESWDCLGTCV